MPKVILKADGTFGDPATCEVCLTKVARSGDIHRHMLSHLPAEEKALKSHACPFAPCGFTSLQKGNVDTHIRTIHTKIKNQRCPEPRCDFATSDPGSLTRHRKRLHKYVPERRKRHSHRPRPSRDNDGIQFVAWTNDSTPPSERRSNCYSLATSDSLSSASGEAYHHLSQVERSISPSDSEQTDSRYSPAYSSERIPSDLRQVTWQNYSVFPITASEHESSARPSCPALGLKHMDSENSTFSGQMALSDSLHISSGMDHRCLLRPAWSPAYPVSPPPVSGQIDNRYTLRPARETFPTSPPTSGKTKNRFSIETRDSSVTYLLYKPRTQPTTQNCDQQHEG